MNAVDLKTGGLLTLLVKSFKHLVFDLMAAAAAAADQVVVIVPRDLIDQLPAADSVTGNLVAGTVRVPDRDVLFASHVSQQIVAAALAAAGAGVRLRTTSHSG